MNPLLYYSLAIYLSAATAAAASSSKDSAKEDNKPCTITSPTTGSFFDLTALQIPDPAQSKAKHPRDYSWNATGYDLGYNFTINFCGPVVEPVDDVVGVEKNLWRNVSAYYKHSGKVYSIGMQNSALVMRGRKLVLNYTDGSPCDSPGSRGSHLSSGRTKSTVISMLCDKDPLAPTLQLSFVGTMDECTYFFEGRSNAACATANTTKSGSLNPSGVFGVIATIAIIVYFVGGCVYNRAVLQQRGWQQVPNYNMWAGIFGFFKDLFIILTSSCARFMPSRRGYSRVSNGYGNRNGRGRARGDSSDAENRLIDELNEEWED
ncbi:cation-independent mannose-6-phosphate receptor CI-MPR [Pseudocercospora fijiensis CIRAD86]